VLETSSLAGLFLVALLAASPVPLQSELVFLAMQATGRFDIWAMVLVASIGNTLGSFITYAVGRGIGGLSAGRLAISPASRARAEGWFARWGVWVLLLSWAPGGDMICAVAGMLRTPLWKFGLLVALAKTGRYLALAGVTGLVLS
jgi:membrane protein YqaA with SNARE-associated domain